MPQPDTRGGNPFASAQQQQRGPPQSIPYPQARPQYGDTESSEAGDFYGLNSSTTRLAGAPGNGQHHRLRC